MTPPDGHSPETRVNLGPVPCSRCGIRDLLDLIRDAQQQRRPLTINFVNAHLFNMAWSDLSFRERLARSDIVAADGMAIVWAARLFGARLPGRCNMTDSFRAYLADPESRPATALLIGGSEQEARDAKTAIERDGPHLRVLEAWSGFLAPDEYAARLTRAPETDFILLGMGSPKSEIVAERLRAAGSRAIVWHIGGGTVMFFAGRLVEAPKWMRVSGFQWLHRLLMEPGRMWRRYVVGNPLFIFRVAAARFGVGPRA